MSVETKYNLLPGLAGTLEKRLSQVVRKITFDVEQGAARRSRVDTGAMKSGWESEFPDSLTGIVSNSVEYTIHHEFGTTEIPAQPMARPAAEEQREPFKRAVADVLNDLGK